MTNLFFVHFSFASSQRSREKPRKSIKLSSFNTRGPIPRVLITEKNMAIIVLDSTHKGVLAEIRPEEAIVEVTTTTFSEQIVTLKTPRGAPNLGIIGVYQVAAAVPF